MLTLDDFDYTLASSQIAQEPAKPRDHSKLLVIDRKTNVFRHKKFFQLPSFLNKGDVLVINNSRTVPARVFGKKETGGSIEVLFVKPIDKHPNAETWEVLTKPGLKKGQRVLLPAKITLVCKKDAGYTRIVQVKGFNNSVLETLKKIGQLPLPHYISKKLQSQHDYQTVYAKIDGSAATPTAGLHFSPNLLRSLKEKGVGIEEITLHVGLGTFLPVKETDISLHKMHREWFTLSTKTALNLNRAKAAGRRIIAVGTTSLRVLESCLAPSEQVQEKKQKIQAKTGETSLYIYPPHSFSVADGLITNFHLPRTTLLMLVSAFASQLEEFHTFSHSLAGKAYQEALEQNYRFYSFGDAMLIL